MRDVHLLDRQELLELTSRLVAIDSTNPMLVAGAAGEHEIARFVAEWFERVGLETHVELVDGRPNVVGIVRITGNGRALMLNAHMDTIGAGSMPDPLRPRVVGGQLYGRGALDMKAGLAAIMMVGAQLRVHPPAGDVIVAAVVDEEWGSVGTKALLAHQRADAAIVTEPTDLRVCVAHKGASSFTITTQASPRTGRDPSAESTRSRRWGRSSPGSTSWRESCAPARDIPYLAPVRFTPASSREAKPTRLPGTLPRHDRAPPAARRDSEGS